MRIMHFAGGGDIGGAKTHILSLGQKLSQDNVFRLISFRPGAFADEAKEVGLDVVVIEQVWNLLAGVRAALAAVDEFRPDVIHCHGAKANMMGVMMKLLRGVPIITTVHSDPRRDYMGMPIKQLLFGSINQIALKQMDFYMSVAGGMQKTLIERGFDPQRIFVIHNGLDFSDAAESHAMPGPENDIVVGVAARLTPIKNLPTLLQAFAQAYARNPRLRLKIAGIGEDEKELRAQAEKLHIAERVDFVGWITDMRQFFSGVDINVLCSFSETFPYSLLEGACEHCPAIASAVGGIPELIEHNKSGLLFQPLDVNAFAEYIYQLSVDEQLRGRLADGLLERARRQYSLEHMRATQQSAYQTVLRRRTRGHERWGVVICGAYGRGNAGDEAILQAIVGQMRHIDRDIPLTVMSRDKVDSRLKNNTDAIYTFNVFAFIRRLRRAEIFINGGGSLIQDVTSSRSLYFYLLTIWMARLSGCRVIMYGCGIGPINSRLNSRIASSVLDNNVEIITLRDSVSQRVLTEMGVTKPQIRISADPTVNLRAAADTELAAAMAREGVPAEADKICFCLRTWPGFDRAADIAVAADYAYAVYGLIPVFIPIELPRDAEAAALVTEKMTAPYYACRQRYSAEELIGMLGQMKLVVGMRLHSLIFATCAASPVVGISYDVKVESFIRDIGSQACISLPDLTAERLCREIDIVVADGYPRAEAARNMLQSGDGINTESARMLLKPSA